MVFSSIIFLLLFLPITLTAYYLVGERFRNLLLLFASLLFYAWGEGYYLAIMIVSIGVNYTIGMQINRSNSQFIRRRWLIAGIIANLLTLGIFKYTNWLVANAAGLFSLPATDILPQPIHLPIGISFFTFQALSYIIDVYRNETAAQQNPFRLGLYIASFPQLIAGPIVRYNQVADQIIKRTHSFALFASGVERFTFGLAKKVLIANPMAAMADRIFALDYAHLPPEVAWLGIICYTLQIYFDFSGYSDMAIGLGRMFGFHFPENFNYPYISRSIQEFWRRWHISLSGWFRDYLYFPLGGNRKGELTTYRNLFIVFLLCGLWHGASWNFVIWGLIHGLFLVLERNILKGWLARRRPLFQHFYALFIVTNAWVFFRIEDLSDALDYLKALYFMADQPINGISIGIQIEADGLFLATFGCALLLATPVFQYLKKLPLWGKEHGKNSLTTIIFKPASLGLLLYISISFLAVNAYNPFIYFRF
ncbi:MAG: MBOAT family protein [Desulfobulbaceae bacterium]|nr:MAG: MBOAT family protein [Desulfobulbaceae bacterium]